MDERTEYVTADEAIERLGIGRATFYNHARGLQRFRRVGDRRVLYRAMDIDEMGELQPRAAAASDAQPFVYEPRRSRKAGRSAKPKS